MKILILFVIVFGVLPGQSEGGLRDRVRERLSERPMVQALKNRRKAKAQAKAQRLQAGRAGSAAGGRGSLRSFSTLPSEEVGAAGPTTDAVTDIHGPSPDAGGSTDAVLQPQIDPAMAPAASGGKIPHPAGNRPKEFRLVLGKSTVDPAQNAYFDCKVETQMGGKPSVREKDLVLVVPKMSALGMGQYSGRLPAVALASEGFNLTVNASFPHADDSSKLKLTLSLFKGNEFNALETKDFEVQSTGDFSVNYTGGHSLQLATLNCTPLPSDAGAAKSRRLAAEESYAKLKDVLPLVEKQDPAAGQTFYAAALRALDDIWALPEADRAPLLRGFSQLVSSTSNQYADVRGRFGEGLGAFTQANFPLAKSEDILVQAQDGLNLLSLSRSKTKQGFADLESQLTNAESWLAQTPPGEIQKRLQSKAARIRDRAHDLKTRANFDALPDSNPVQGP